MKPEHSRLEKVLIETMTLLCKNSLAYSTELKIQGVLAITIDCSEVMVVHIDKILDAVDGFGISTNPVLKQEYSECSSTDRETDKSHCASTVSDNRLMKRNAEEADDSHVTLYDKQQQQQQQWDYMQSQDSENDVLIVDGRTSEEGPVTGHCANRGKVKNEFQGPASSQNYHESHAILHEEMNDFDYSGASNYDQSTHWNQSHSFPRQSVMSRRPIGKISTPRSRGRRRLSLSSPRSSLGRGFAAAAGVDNFESSFGAHSSPSVSSGNVDGFSYGKVTLTNYVCNLCGVVYKHHCNLLTHQVKAHGRQKKRGAGRPPLRAGQEPTDSMQSFE